MTIAESLLPELDQEMTTTRRVLVREARAAVRQTINRHHRGQLSVLLDVPVPSIYGPTADEGWG